MRIVVGMLVLEILHAIFQIILPQFVRSEDALMNFTVGIRVTFFACILLVIGIITLLQSIRCLRNFGKGLREHCTYLILLFACDLLS